ncbi:coil containing protein [Vibrio phage 1.063.O._10N.261.45.C7]|nr:coil containing protein [Vibrio phage 1.063.O._10N.261.45.C7]
MDNQKGKNGDFQQNAISSAPKWAISICGILLALSMSLKLSDIDVSTPLNRYFNALATTMESGAVNGSQKDFNSDVSIRIDNLEERVTELSEVAHAPKGKLLYPEK